MKKLWIIFFMLIVSTTTARSAEQSKNWRTLLPENLAVISLPHGNVYIELAPQFSPNHVNRFKALVNAGYYDGEAFYRVIDGFVAQAGPADGSEKDKSVKALAIEDEFTMAADSPFTLVQDNEMFADQTGFQDGFALGRSSKDNKAWLLHCPGVIAMARESDPNTATGHFYITNGQAPRYLDRIMTIFGRVIHGMNHVQAIKRTSTIEGQTAVDPKEHTAITKVQMMSQLPTPEQITFQVQDTQSNAYKKTLAERKSRPHAFFYKKPKAVLDICQTPVKTRIITK